MAFLKSMTQAMSVALTTVEDIQKAWSENPDRLINFLQLQSDRRGTGVRCPYCGSGSGEHGTGMQYYKAPKTGYMRLKCFASNCDANKDPFDLVMELNEDTPDFCSAKQLLAELYIQETSKLDDYVPCCEPRAKLCAPTLDPEQLLPVYNRSIDARKACPAWQARVAALMGLPASALDRPDIGKAYLTFADGSTDAYDETAGDLVTYNLVDGMPLSLKVRYTPLLNTYQGFMLFYNTETNAFGQAKLSSPATNHAFRMAGRSGQLCFGHDFIKDAELVVIVEGQSDVLAVTAAFQQMGLHDHTAIGRDSSSHKLQVKDLDALYGKTVIYAEDFDTIGSPINKKNLEALYQYRCTPQVWSAPSAEVKDPRAFLLTYGAETLVESLLSAPSFTPNVTFIQ